MPEWVTESYTFQGFAHMESKLNEYAFNLTVQNCVGPAHTLQYDYGRIFYYYCPKETGFTYVEDGSLVCQSKYYITPTFSFCADKEGNPCDPASGNKTEMETDYVLRNSDLKVQRYYASQGIGDGFGYLGLRWRHNYSQHIDEFGVRLYDRYLDIKSPLYSAQKSACEDGWRQIKNKAYQGLLSDTTAVYNGGVCEIQRNSQKIASLIVYDILDGYRYVDEEVKIHQLSRGNGQLYTFVDQGGNWQPLYPGTSSLTQSDTGWIYKAANGDVETYSVEGRLASSKNTYGQITRFTYDDQGRLDTVTGPFDDTLAYHYEDNRLAGITTPEGDLGYGYDAEGRLTRVTYVDGSERHYHYEDSRFPYHLTGITDENNERFATWAYDEEGRAISSEHADGAERVAFTYNSDGTTTVTDAAGAERTYHFIVKRGAMKVDHIDGDRCTTCANGGTKSYTYDSNGFVATKTDWNGNITTYERDAQGRELSRTEASGTPQAKTVATTWDTTLNKSLIVTEPGQVTSYTYDAKGRLQTKQQRAQP
ncbi:MAG: DUF6531 domain-containing protein [Candidatus Thiodiazotropha sp.]